MKVIPTEHPEILLIEPDVFPDPRGFFMETFQARKFAEAGLPTEFLQDNLRGVLRDLHYQLQHPQRTSGSCMRYQALLTVFVR